MAELQSRNSEVGTSVCQKLKYAEIVVIRHGETEWNVERRIQGQLGVALNDLGRKQAFALAERLSREPKLDAVYSSDLKRALETAEMIAQRCGLLKVIIDPDLRERHLGDLQGLLFVEADKLSQEDPRFRRRNHDDAVPGGGESYDQLYNRCTSALQRIANQHIGERVAVVSHGVAIEAFYTKAHPFEARQGKVGNASINVFHLFDNQHQWSVESWNDVTHLKYFDN